MKSYWIGYESKVDSQKYSKFIKTDNLEKWWNEYNKGGFTGKEMFTLTQVVVL